jgi:hypothetical protein
LRVSVLLSKSSGAPISNFLTHHSSLETGSSLIHEGEVLLIKSLTKESAGRYECHASNGVEPVIKKIISITFKGTSQNISQVSRKFHEDSS